MVQWSKAQSLHAKKKKNEIASDPVALVGSSICRLDRVAQDHQSPSIEPTNSAWALPERTKINKYLHKYR